MRTAKTPEEGDQLYQLYLRRAELDKQLASLERSRRTLAIWHTIHVPIGLATFLIALVHIAGTLYYATLLH